jgi:hypothetical protein
VKPHGVWPSLAAAVLVFGFGAVPLAAENVVTIRSNGDPANRVDILILGDGYTASEMVLYAGDVENFIRGLFGQKPFNEYEPYFNVHRIDVVSLESGADHPSRGIYKNTALDATYESGGIARLLVVNNTKVDQILNSSTAPDQRDIVVIVVNDPEYGGSGGRFAVASVHPSVVELVLHEVGHSFGLLADEYDTTPPACDSATEPSQVNVTKQMSRALIKWNSGGGPPFGWIDFQTPVPTTGFVPSVPGLYEGAKYCRMGLFRPTFNSKMRSLSVPFDPINEEQLVKRIYNRVSPLDSFSPAEGNLILDAENIVVFRAAVPRPASHALQITWLLDGETAASGAMSFTPSISDGRRTHRIELLVQDPTPLVRLDTEALLQERKIWNVRVGRIAAPLDFQGVRILNRTFSQAEDIDRLTWKSPPGGDDIVKYRISVKSGDSWVLLADPKADVLEYRHRLVERNKAYEYAVTAVDGAGIEGLPAVVIVK